MPASTRLETVTAVCDADHVEPVRAWVPTGSSPRHAAPVAHRRAAHAPPHGRRVPQPKDRSCGRPCWRRVTRCTLLGEPLDLSDRPSDSFIPAAGHQVSPPAADGPQVGPQPTLVVDDRGTSVFGQLEPLDDGRDWATEEPDGRRLDARTRTVSTVEATAPPPNGVRCAASTSLASVPGPGFSRRALKVTIRDRARRSRRRPVHEARGCVRPWNRADGSNARSRDRSSDHRRPVAGRPSATRSRRAGRPSAPSTRSSVA